MCIIQKNDERRKITVDGVCVAVYSLGNGNANRSNGQMEDAIKSFLEEKTADEIRAAYDELVEWSDAPEGYEFDDIDNMLNLRGLPSLSQRIVDVAT